MAQSSLAGQDHLIIEALRSHSDTPHTVGYLYMSDQPDTEVSDNTQHSTRDKHPCLPVGFEPQFQQASGRRPTS